MNNVGKAALLGGVALLLAGSKTSDKSAKVPALAAQPITNQTIDANTLYDLFLTNPDLQKLFKGAKGDTGATGGIGATGAAGDWTPTYGGSLLRNGALELGTTINWTGTGVAIAVAANEGMNVLEGSVLNNSTEVYLRNDRLYKAEWLVKGTGSYALYASIYNKAGALEPKTSASSTSYFKATGAMPSSFTKAVGYIGGVGAGATNISANAVKMRVSILGASSATVSICKLVLTEVSLGEPVPYNLSFLPTWQTVYDPTTGDLGVYNGTAVVWAS